ncbi:MAG: DUF1460 domain-containing protein [Phycisphaerae bacterium]|nr:DUF1460 domain-containing protein [Phycisphaerae bacterium]
MKRLLAWVLLFLGLGGLGLTGVVGQSADTPPAAQKSEPVAGDTSGPLSSVETARHRELAESPVHSLHNEELAEFLGLHERVLAANRQVRSGPEELAVLTRRTLGQPYRLNAARFDLAESDCVVFVERSLALSLARDWSSYYRLSERLRHKDGVVDYRNRNFLTLGDWVPNNSLLLRDVSKELGPATDRPAKTFTHVVRPKVFEEVRDEKTGVTRVIFKGSDYVSGKKEIREDVLIPRERMADVLPDLRTGDVVLVLRASAGGHMGCDHMGLIAVQPDGAVTLVHSVPSQVRQEPLTRFLDRCNWVLGLRFLRLRDNAADLAAAEVKRIEESVKVPTPTEVETDLATRRAARAAQEAVLKP